MQAPLSHVGGMCPHAPFLPRVLWEAVCGQAPELHGGEGKWVILLLLSVATLKDVLSVPEAHVPVFPKFSATSRSLK